ncbi:chaperone DnaJ-domain superfamily protein [Striga asiatica]|uniref:Chaperone DnaJ-domain superfamily protein n=1 Tax=Striga asiatica TaxID=4170 RepID=A0A5A7QPX9_STRAF|nr:chaperone DnaJ-domain superfamily protein [Striga asiatica]
MSSEKDEDITPRQRLSCSKYFDALWFCYSPVHQMQQYYRLGSLDNCSGKWGALYDCLNLKTKRASEVEEILKTREKSVPHIWSFRSPKEARYHWQKLFGHLDDQE